MLPTAQSGTRTRQVRYPVDAEIVVQVTAVTMRIADPNAGSSESAN